MNKREKEFLQLSLEAEEDILHELENQYQESLNQINEKIRLLQSNELTQSKIYQLEYQKALKGQIEGIIEKMHGDQYTTLQEYLSNSYTDAFIGTMYNIAGQGIPLMIPIDQAAAVKAIITDSKISKGLYASLGVDANKLKKTIRQEITRGISTAMTYEDIARNISNVSKAPLSRAKTIARTEGHRIQQASTMDAQTAAKSRGADVVKQWDSTLDGRTRSTHRQLDGQIREVEEPFELGRKKAMYPGDFGDPAEDCNCRCASLTRAKWALDEDELQTLKDRAKFFGLDKTEDFKGFKDKYLKAAEQTAKAEKPASAFVPAKTIEEAEEYAQRFVSSYKSKFSGTVSYKGLSVDSANTLNRTLEDLYSRADLPKLRNIKPMNFRESIWKDSKNTPMAYRNMGDGDLHFNPKILKDKKSVSAYFAEGERAYKFCAENIEKFSGKNREMVERYIKAGRSLVAGDAKDSLSAVIQHEMGHHIQNQIIVHDKAAAKIVADGFEKYSGSISGYATKTHGEYIAESFCAYMNGESEKIDPALKKYFEGLVK